MSDGKILNSFAKGTNKKPTVESLVEKNKVREEIEGDVKKFLESGGVIKKLPHGATAILKYAGNYNQSKFDNSDSEVDS